MTIQEALRTFLLADAPLATAIGDRLYWARLPQKPTYPCVMLEAISSPGIGDMVGETSLRRMRVQVTAYHPMYLNATTTLKLVRDAVHGFTGQMAGGSGVLVEGMDLEGGDQERDGVDDELDVMTKQLDFVCWFQEA